MKKPKSVSGFPTIRSRFFRALVISGSCMAIAASLGVGIVDAFTMRQTFINNLIYYSEAMSRVSAFNIDNQKELNQHLEDFRGLPGLTQSCVYDELGALIASWRTSDSPVQCPKLITQAGMHKDLFSLSITRQVIDSKNAFKGMIYIEGELKEMKFVLVRIFVTTVVLLISVVFFCAIIARRTAERINQPLLDLENHVDCLQSGSNAVCGIPEADATEETLRLYKAVTRLRDKLLSSMVTIEQMEVSRRWQTGKLSGLLSLLRSRMAADSTLLPCFADHELMLQMDAGRAVESTVFDLQEIADRAMATAKRIQPPDPSLHAMLSIKGGVPRQWVGDPLLLEALLRQLMLVALKRTDKGMACLRLESVTKSAQTQMSNLHFMLEDTGSDVQLKQVERLLKEAREGQTSSQEPIELTWLVIARAVQALQGNLTVSTNQAKGLVIQGWLPMQPAAIQLAANRVTAAMTVTHSEHPLVLLVEDDRVNRQMQAALLRRQGCDVFAVTKGIYALEWAPILPFSLIILDQMLPDMTGSAVAMKLNAMMQSHLMPEVPLAALSAADTTQLRNAWTNVQAMRMFAKPLNAHNASLLVRDLDTVDHGFFDYANEDVRREIPSSLKPRLHELRGQLQHQLHSFCELLAKGGMPSFEAAHAVKSAALTLGYERLAGCLNAIEHDAVTRAAVLSRDNIAVILKCLRMFAVENQNPAQRVALSS